MHAGFVLPLECADTYLSKRQSGSKIKDECNIKCHRCSLSNACASLKYSAENLESGFKFYLWQNKFSRFNKLSEQKGEKPTYFCCRDNRTVWQNLQKIICYMVHFKRKANRCICCGREKGHYDPILWCVQFPFYSPLLGRCTRQVWWSSRTHILRASGNLLVSAPHPKPTKGHFSFLLQSVLQHIYTLNTKNGLLHANSEQQKIKQDGRKTYSSLFLIAEEHD